MVSAGSGDPSLQLPSRGGRYRSLDGLRGLAALAVAICHTFMVQPSLMQAFVNPALIPSGSVAWWLTFSPLHLAWAGTEMVYIFFVLSGFVLTIPFMNNPPARKWALYYPKRLIRLYLPVWGAVGLSVALMTAFPRTFSPGDSLALVFQPSGLDPAQLRGDLLLWPNPGASNNVLWTLKLEVMFSLLLPLVVVLAKSFPKLNPLKAILLVIAVYVFSSPGPDLKFFLPMFALGSVMAVERSHLHQLGDWIGRRRFSTGIWLVLAMVALILLNSNWNLLAVTMETERLAALLPLVRTLILAGACLVMVISLEGPWKATLQTPVLQWLGSRSFSLYLVHWPLIVTVAVLMGGRPILPASLAVAAPVFLVGAEIFYRLVERPVQLLCRRIDTAAAEQRRPEPLLAGGPVPAID